MKKLLCALLMLVLIAPAAGAEGVERVDLGYRMLKPLRDALGQYVCSPLSLRLALGMAAAGAEGETLAQLEALLGGAGDVPRAEYDELLSANAAVVASDIALKQDYEATLSGAYGALMMPLGENTMSELNAWVSERTGGMIDGVLTEQPSADVMLLLVNALMLDAKWERAFFGAQSGTFHGASGDTQAQFMRAFDAFLEYAESDGLRSVKLPYEGGGLEMIVALPEAGGMDDLLARLGERGLSALGEFSDPRSVNLSLPKFSLQSELDMKALAQSLGVTHAFGDAADFSAISDSPELYISAILQKARIDVDEQGTRAAAATKVEVSAKGLNFDVIELRVDRPFLALVRAADSGELLFAAVVEDL